MKQVLLIGLGRFGMGVAEKLSELNHRVMAIDRDEERVNRALRLATEARIGDSTSPEFLSSLGVGNFDVCIVTIGEDFQSSLETTSLLKELGAKKVISRASRDVHKKFLLRNGADEVVYPERQLAAWTAMRYTSDNILDAIELDSDYSIFELTVPRDWTGRTVGSLDVRKRWGLNVLAIKKNEKISMVITPDTVFSEGENVLVVGRYKDIQRCFRL